MALGRYADFVYIALAVAAVFGALYLYTGVWPPAVVVESNSMMHVDPAEYEGEDGTARAEDVGFARLGTLDPGDLVLIHEVDARSQVDTFAHPDGDSYGRPGDVIAFTAEPDDRRLTVIHRAMTYVDVRDSGGETRYVVEWTDAWDEPEGAECARQGGYRCVFGSEGVSIPEIGMFENQLGRSGFLTKGDNVASNPGVDQARTGTEVQALKELPVTVDEIEGKASAELPGLGLLKLAFTGDRILNADMQDHRYFLRIGNMVAPLDLWLVLGGELVAISVAPVAWSVARGAWEGREIEASPELSVLAEAHRDRQARARSREREAS